MERWNSAGIGASICREVKNGLTVVGCARNSQRIQEIAEKEDIKKSSGRLHAINVFHFGMECWHGCIALVTGASSGIGASICRELVKNGLTVVGCARNSKRIQEIAEEEDIKTSPGRLHAIKCDLSQESEILSMFSRIRSRFGRIDICINNAAFSTHSPLLSGETSDWRSMLEVNVLALCICSREAIKLMKEKGIDNGQIIQISSLGGHRLPTSSSYSAFNFYCATKSMVRTLTEGLRMEVKADNTHIRVASITPGVVETEFLARTYDAEKATKIYNSVGSLKAKDVANAVLYILQTPPHVDVNDIIMQPVEESLI